MRTEAVGARASPRPIPAVITWTLVCPLNLPEHPPTHSKFGAELGEAAAKVVDIASRLAASPLEVSRTQRPDSTAIAYNQTCLPNEEVPGRPPGS